MPFFLLLFLHKAAFVFLSFFATRHQFFLQYLSFSLCCLLLEFLLFCHFETESILYLSVVICCYLLFVVLFYFVSCFWFFVFFFCLWFVVLLFFLFLLLFFFYCFAKSYCFRLSLCNCKKVWSKIKEKHQKKEEKKNKKEQKNNKNGKKAKQQNSKTSKHTNNTTTQKKQQTKTCEQWSSELRVVISVVNIPAGGLFGAFSSFGFSICVKNKQTGAMAITVHGHVALASKAAEIMHWILFHWWYSNHITLP